MVSTAGDKENPVVIWTSKKPRYFRGVEISSLPMKYFHQSKASMTGDILNKILSTFNHKMIQQKWSIPLLIDNVGCHPKDTKEKYSNIKTTFKLQPLNLVIIANFKTHDSRLLLRFVLSSIVTCNSASEVVHSVTILTAIRWISKAWMEVKPETVSRCFRRAGILTEQMCVTSVVQLQGPDPFAVMEAEMELTGLICGVMGTSEQCSSEVYVSGDNELDTCV